jgi:hypothetical protein
MELEGLPVPHDRMAGVVTPLEPDDHIRPFREEVGHLALPFVAPLGSDYH